jgi:hypothetical protein
MFFKQIIAALLFAAALPTAQAAQPVYTFQVHSPGIQAVAAPAASLYPFSSFTFTTCGATGVSGPQQSACRSAYSGATWAQADSYYTVSAGIQSWVVPATGSYLITAAGASGGNAVASAGVGTVISAQVTLTQGTVLKLLVGQSGANGPTSSGGGGGGGGFNSDGTNASNAASFNYAGHGSSFQNGGQGGNSATTAIGGFGGGAGTHGSSGGGGGGGGYSGGGGSGQTATAASAGGGGSYSSWTLVSATVSNLGAGHITITRQ